MKQKLDFVTNSSSTSFIITNISNKKKKLDDFVKENPQLIDEFLENYNWNKNNPLYTQENLIKNAKIYNITFKAGEEKCCIFGDEDGTLIGMVFDYILREGGTSESFTWKFHEYLR